MSNMHKIALCWSLLLLCLSPHSTAKENSLPIQVQVYYETLCPDSINFIVQQLYPTFHNLGQYLDVEFIPYGFASYLPNGNGGWNFECQHGANECSGNLYAACLVDALKNDNAVLVEVISCIMSDHSPHTATEKCIGTLNIDGVIFEEIEECHSSEVGENLLHDFGVKTDDLNPSCTFIPWITIDNVWNEVEFEAALEDFQGLLCSDRLADKPECNENILPVQVEVYYETLCPYSIDFINQQLYPTFQNLGQYLDIEFIPYGNAQSLPNGNGGWNFDCQHGPRECSGNMYAACLVDALKNDEPLLVEVINCIMSDPSPHTATEKCMDYLMIEEPSFQDIEECHSSDVGENLLYDFGVKTVAAGVYGVPWITIDDVFTEVENETGFIDFQGLLCSDILADKPECNVIQEIK